MLVDILLSTYNSQDYIEDLFDSVLAQTCENWSLIVRDDCSTDDTVSILNNFKKLNDSKITVINNGDQRLGPKKSFEKLLENSNLLPEHKVYIDKNKSISHP